MNLEEMRKLDAAGLQNELNALLKAHMGLRMQKATQQLQNTSQLTKVRRDIARIRTLIRQNTMQES
ncbi:MAG: 50S ribosomal protein L29 [Betaproteobacteria bacterium]|nr:MULTISPECIES: 50S ribosomal protein L29 [Thiomonas]MDA8119693.1 50S ribosomal protein L29 [Gammaproteobacteria bacterium]MDE2130096.1 50S ribosomal protein L29 [Betaproteobacteria bacterium]OZB45114.1 MAG: 50S ribosomal protein L29 [Thiomonas sp. 15-66-11]OZB64333.1 MAG: 50S ribosomal protein L29 [Thiomonas sp. 13-66-29]